MLLCSKIAQVYQTFALSIAIAMNYAEKVMLHQMVQQTVIDRKAYEALPGKFGIGFWFMGKRRAQSVLSDVIDRYVFDRYVINRIAERECHELTLKKDLNEESSMLYSAQAHLLETVVELRIQMIETLKAMNNSITFWRGFSPADVSRITELSDDLIVKLRNLSDVSRLLEKYDKPFYFNNRKFH